MSTKNPVNNGLLRARESDLARLGQVKELQIFGQGSNFHPEGLFSIQIFGPIGSEARLRTFGYIDLHHDLLHPLVYRTVIGLKSYYKGIMDGSVYALWDAKTREFVKSNDSKAQSGFSFFMSHIKELAFERNDSDKRNDAIAFFDKAVGTDKHLLRYLLVMPAGLRDYTVNPSGKPEQDEINTFYRRLLAQSQLVDPAIARKNAGKARLV